MVAALLVHCLQRVQVARLLPKLMNHHYPNSTFFSPFKDRLLPTICNHASFRLSNAKHILKMKKQAG